MSEKRFVYADNAATTQVSQPVFDAMLPWLRERYGNPSSIYSIGRESRAAIEKSRAQVAAALGALPEEIFFTGCGTESDNWALKGMAHRLAPQGKNHLITTAFEHHAILHSCDALEKEGFTVTRLPVDAEGLLFPEVLDKSITEKTALVSVMFANNEIGTVEPIAALAEVAHRHGVAFHTDAVQAVGHVAINVKEMGIDLLSLSGHKFHAPKGIGVLYVRKGLMPVTFMDGGGQESHRRAGTENIAGIVGLGEAIERACADIPAKAAQAAKLRDRLMQGLTTIPHSRVNGSTAHRLPGNLNISFEGVEGESLLLMLDAAGICASSGSACTSGSLGPSHVLTAIGLPAEVAHGSLRLTLGDTNTEADVDYILEKLPPIIERLRAMSPVWEKIVAAEKQKTAR